MPDGTRTWGWYLRADECEICHGKISMQIFRGTGVCCERCRKVRDGEKPHGS